MEQKKKNEESALSTWIVNQYAQQRGLKKKIQVFFFSMAINISKDNFDIAEFSLNKTFFH